MAHATAPVHTVEKGQRLSDEAAHRTSPDQSGTKKVEPLAIPVGSSVDAALVARARAGDPDAFESLARRHLAAAHRVALGRVRNSQDAEDVCQDAFVTALKKLDSCERPEQFRAWFLTIVRNRAHNVRKYQDVRRTEPIEHAGAAATRDDPHADVDRRRIRTRITEALATLTDLQRQVVVFHDYEGRRHQEIGDALGISPGASRFHLHVARKRLREELADLKSYLPGGQG